MAASTGRGAASQWHGDGRNGPSLLERFYLTGDDAATDLMPVESPKWTEQNLEKVELHIIKVVS